jgi:hypothetical protein
LCWVTICLTFWASGFYGLPVASGGDDLGGVG